MTAAATFTAAFDAGGPVDLARFLEEHRADEDGSHAEWNPESYPALVYHLAHPAARLAVYATGRGVCIAATQRIADDKAYRMEVILQQYRVAR